MNWNIILQMLRIVVHVDDFFSFTKSVRDLMRRSIRYGPSIKTCRVVELAWLLRGSSVVLCNPQWQSLYLVETEYLECACYATEFLGSWLLMTFSNVCSNVIFLESFKNKFMILEMRSSSRTCDHAVIKVGVHGVQTHEYVTDESMKFCAAFVMLKGMLKGSQCSKRVVIAFLRTL